VIERVNDLTLVLMHSCQMGHLEGIAERGELRRFAQGGNDLRRIAGRVYGKLVDVYATL
jgi:hypothetical protein